MSDTVKIIIEIPKEAKQAFDIANDLKGGYYDYGGIIGRAIQNGIPLDTVKAERCCICGGVKRFGICQYCGTDM